MGWPVFRATLLPVLLLAAAYIQAGCAPAFQDARVVPPGQVEITPSFSGAGFSAEGESEYSRTHSGPRFTPVRSNV